MIQTCVRLLQIEANRHLSAEIEVIAQHLQNEFQSRSSRAIGNSGARIENPTERQIKRRLYEAKKKMKNNL